MIEQAKEVAQRLRELDAAKKHHPTGPGGQMMGCESYRLIATGFTFQTLHDGADMIDSLVAEVERLTKVEPVFCEYCGGNDEDPVDHCMDCARPNKVDVEPVMIYHGRCIIDCGEHGHNDVEMLKMIPAGTKLYTASALAALQAENERLKEASDFDHAEYKRLRDELRTKLAEAQADAARWKWFQENVYRYPYDDHGCGPEFDLSNEAIDAAMGDV